MKKTWYTSISDNTPFTQTDFFYYNASGLLVGTKSTYTFPPGFGPSGNRTDSTNIAYNGSIISNIKSYSFGSVFLEYKFTYDLLGNPTKIEVIDPSSGWTRTDLINWGTDGNFSTNLTKVTFDTKRSIVSTLPFWQYFRTQQHFNVGGGGINSFGIVNGMFSLYPSKNNILNITLNSGTQNSQYNYQYNSDELPATSTIVSTGIGIINETYQYEYIKVN